jgi:pilus assembly protein Flp/PilA
VPRDGCASLRASQAPYRQTILKNTPENPHIFQGFSEIARTDEHVPRRTATDQFRIVRYETDDPDSSWTPRGPGTNGAPPLAINSNEESHLRAQQRPRTHAWHTRCDWVRRAAASRRARNQTNCGAAAELSTAAAVPLTHPKEDGMSKLVAFVNKLKRNEEGQDLLEYALLVALIALVAITAVTAAGGAVDGIFTAIAGALAGAA